ncbi:hypothetical protein L9F63_006789, partial [Diploptera punctata]
IQVLPYSSRPFLQVLTTPGLEHPNFWLILYCLNQLRYGILPSVIKLHITTRFPSLF